MGVHGLTTYLRENHRVLSKTVQLPRKSISDDVVTTVVVDGWSFIYEVYQQSHLPWVYGGEYADFARHVEQVVLAWIAVGLKVYFVFDGPSPELKIPTIINRLNRSNVDHSLIFFRTSPISRSTPRFLHEARMLPPLALETCVHTLQRLARPGKLPLEVHFADEEGDPYAVELAGRLGAHVVAKDSDFVIFNSDHYAGYIPMDSMLWTAPEGTTDMESEGIGSDDFQTVMHTKKRRPEVHNGLSYGLIPPEASRTDLTLSASIYTPAALALHLKIPVSILPLLASLVGNDFTNQSSTQRNIQSLFFERSLSLSQRITRTASTLAGILNTATQPRKARHRVGSVMDLIDRTVNALLIRSPSQMASGEVDAIVDRVVTATLQYAIDKYEGGVIGPASIWLTPICALHIADACPLAVLFRNAQRSLNGVGSVCQPDAVTMKLGTMYVEAYRAGTLKPEIAHILSSNSFWPMLFLENPDVETVARSIGRPIRRWIYALLEDGVGLAETPEEEPARVEVGGGGDVEVEVEVENLDEFIDVVEEDSSDEDADPLAPLRGELERLRATDADSVFETPTSASSRSRPDQPLLRPKRVLEYIRRGCRIAAEEVPVPDIAGLLSAFSADTINTVYVPFQLRSVEERMSLFLHVLESDLPQVRALPRVLFLGVLVMRWVVRTLHLRAVESGTNKDREQERWTRREARAFLAFYVQSSSDDTENTPTRTREDPAVPITDRNVQLMAQVLMAIETIQDLSQVLFLTDQVPVNVERLSGLRFHAYLSGSEPVPAEALPESLWEACVQSLDDAFGEEKSKNKKKARGMKADDDKRGGRRVVVASRRGRFGLLHDTEA